MEQLKGLITLEALKVLDNIYRRLTEEEYNYQNVMTELFQEYDPVSDKAAAKEALRECKWMYYRGEPLQKFRAKIEELVGIGWPKLARGSDELKDEIKTHFCNGLPDEFQNIARGDMEKSSLSELIDKIQKKWRIHREIKYSFGSKSQRSSVYDYPVRQIQTGIIQ